MMRADSLSTMPNATVEMMATSGRCFCSRAKTTREKPAPITAITSIEAPAAMTKGRPSPSVNEATKMKAANITNSPAAKLTRLIVFQTNT